jgi:phosphoglucosamine mutase
MRNLFGTDGVRGVANEYPMTADVALKLGQTIGHVIKTDHNGGRVVVGKDTRLSGYMLEYALVSGICSMGVDVMLVGPLPTPGIAFITSSMRADAGVVISASHNPYQDNGIKIFSGLGLKLPDEVEERIEKIMFQEDFEKCACSPTDIGQASRIDDATGRYICFLKSTFPKDLKLDGLKIALDCAHGATYKVAPAVLTELGAEVIPFGVRPNGRNINRQCGSTYPTTLQSLVRRHDADLGIALDGDGDRILLVDNEGNLVDGDHIMAICAQHLLQVNSLRKKTLVGTVMSNLGLEVAMKRLGGRLLRTQVGDRYVIERMLNGGYNLGGEQSGHIIFLDHCSTGDGTLSALQLLAIVQRTGKTLHELAQVMEVYPQTLINVKVREKKDLKDIPPVFHAIRIAEKKLGNRGRILIRYSGTEPKLRVMCEGEDLTEVETIAQEIADVIESHLGLET